MIDNTEKIEHIYHYTNLNALQKILKTNEFIFSDFAKANDYKEKSAKYKDEISKYKYISFTYDKELESYSYTNAPLWYFYADKGHGACICFNKEKLLQATKTIRKGFVDYRNGVSHIDNQSIDEYLMEKRKDWLFEKEYRVIVDVDCHSIPNIIQYITAIYIGAEVSEEEIGKFYHCIPKNISVFQMWIDIEDGRYQSIDYREKIVLKQMNDER